MEAHVRGATLRSTCKYVVEKRGTGGLRRLNDEMGKRGAKVDLDEIVDSQWYPFEDRLIMLEAAKELFGWDDAKIIEWGRSAVRVSSVMGFFIKYFTTPEKALRNAPMFWEKNYDTGKLVVTSIEPGKGTFKIVGMHLTKVFCNYTIGLIQGIGDIAGYKGISVVETKCSNDENVHEFVLTWPEK